MLTARRMRGRRDRYGLVADAGSTGTRVYLFYLADDEKLDVKDMGKGPALSSFQVEPARAVEAVKPQLEKALGLIPAEVRVGMPVYVYATAGMRLVPTEVQRAIYDGLRWGLAGANLNFDMAHFEARTISGREEGIFALIAANYLAKRLHTSLFAKDTLMGILDLGGSSTQVAAPPQVASGEHLAPKLGPADTFVRSFLNLGMERMRNRTYARIIKGNPAGHADSSVSNPCAFAGYAEAGEVWRGTGSASKCEAEVRAVLKEERTHCLATDAEPTTNCLSAEPVPLPVGPKASTKFFLISGFMYVTDFASWLFGQHKTSLGTEHGMARPTVAELREAAKFVCNVDWATVGQSGLDPARKHKFTQPHKLPHRCFEMNYIVALLSSGYGFKDHDRFFDIVNDIDGGEIEWTLGAFLHSLASLPVEPLSREL